MSEAKHTPGPWVVTESNQGLKSVISREFDRNSESAVGCAIAFTVFREGRKIEEIQADARLIAAAPDLLAACKGAIQEIEAYGEISSHTAWQIRAVIAKAEGGK